jgi:anti-anti-sigma regulatory factor
MAPIVCVDLRLAPAELRAVDALARLVVAARQLGVELRLAGASDDLRDLIELAGLSGALRLEAKR